MSIADPSHIDLTVPIIMLAAAVLVTSVVQRLHASAIVGYLLAGLIIGPAGFGWIQNTPTTQFLADLGVVFLLFAVGLELPLERLRVMRHLVFGFGGLSMIVLMIIFGAMVYSGHHDLSEAIVIGCALAFSSTALLVQLLSERGEFATRYGRASFAAALFQDLMVVPLLVIIPIINQGREEIAPSLLIACAKALVVLVVIMYLGRLVLRPFYRIVIGNRNHELFTAMTLLVVLALSLSTFHFGLSMALGAFLAGVILSETEFRHQIAADIEPFRGLLLGLFFMTVGMMINLDLIMTAPVMIFTLLAVMLAIKAGVFYGLARAFDLNVQKSLKTAILLSQGGEFAFVIFGLALHHKAVLPESVSMYSSIVILSMILTPFLVRWAWPYLSSDPVLRDESNVAVDEGFQDRRDHVVIAGFGRVGEVVAEMLASQKIPYIVIDERHDRVALARARDLPVFYGDASKPHVLRSVGVEQARAVVVAESAAKRATRLAHTIRENWPDVAIFGRARDSEHAKKLMEAGVTVSVPITLNASIELGTALLQSMGHDSAEVDRAVEEVRKSFL